jgi:hypothetical protein
MDRSNHYEAAFEDWLQERNLCYVAVDETRRAMLGGSRVKSLDFIVHGPLGARLLIDVKGRRFPGGPPERPRRVWESWCMEEDVDGLSRWTEQFGPGFQGLLVFAYHVLPQVDLPADTPDVFHWGDRRYLLRAVDVFDYAVHMRVRSPKWATVSLPGSVFRELVRPIQCFTHAPAMVSEECPF